MRSDTMDREMDNPDFLELVGRYLDDDPLTPAERACLNEELQRDPERRATFVRFCLQAKLVAEAATVEGSLLSAGSEQSQGAVAIEPDSAPASPKLGFFSGATNALAGYFPEGMLFSYVTAAVLLGIGLLVCSFITISRQSQVAVNETTDPSVTPSPETNEPSVGRITGLVDCEWSNPQESLPIDARVPQGRAIALASGLLEITYDSGAKVILEGPCSYEVESPRGGFLSLGKLTARVEKEGLGIRDLGLASNTTVSRHSNPQSLIPNPLFTVRTPTATVTDLGTEFGVEVSKDRRNSVRVYQGRVAVASTKIKKAKLGGMVLHAGQSASLDAGGAVTNVATVEPRGKTPGSRVAATEFVRQLPKRIEANGRIDLLDIVAGGDGFGNRRGSGIDPATGEKVDAHAGVYRMSGPYHRVTWTPLIDGVFVPNSSKGPVQLDSAGHGIDGLAASVGRAYEVIWAARNASEFEMLLKMPWFGQLRRNDPNVTDRTGVLVMHADMGMTFDLAAIRKAHPEIVRLLRFRSVAGIAHFGGVSDISVFVDGKPRWNHRWCADWSGPAVADVSLPSDARFLTFVVTDSDGNISCDYTAFVAPVLEVVKRENKALKQ